MSGLGWTRLDHTRPEITLKSTKIAAIYIGSTCLTLCDPPWRNIDATASHTNPHRRMSVLCASQCIATLTLIIPPSTQLLPHTDPYWLNTDVTLTDMNRGCDICVRKCWKSSALLCDSPKFTDWPWLTLTQRKWNEALMDIDFIFRWVCVGGTIILLFSHYLGRNVCR